MKTLPFWKMSGSGNDFVVIDNRRPALRGSISRWAQKLCHRQFGVGADGLLLLEPSVKGAFRMRYYNADGSRATMCGNGARCMAWVAHEKKVAGRDFQFLTDAGLVGAMVRGATVEVTLSNARDYRPLFPLKLGAQRLRVAAVDTGVPHVVVRVPDVSRVALDTLGPLLRYHKAFGPKGTNVNFVERVSAQTLKVRTYERGVEDETLACGTGVTASAIVGVKEGWVTGPVRCQTAGGDTLQVRFVFPPSAGRSVATEVRLKGPVRLTFKGEFHV